MRPQNEDRERQQPPNEQQFYSSNNYNGLQDLNQYLMSDGDELLSETNNLENLLQSNERQASTYKRASVGADGGRVQTNQTSSSFHNAPMSYSSTNSRGYMNEKLGRLRDMGSPMSIHEETKENYKMNTERPGRLSDIAPNLQSSTKKSVKFLDEQNESRIQRLGAENSVLFSGPTDNILGSNYKDYEIDTSQIVQTKIDRKMNEINQRYFSNDGVQVEAQNEKRLKPIIKVQENQSYLSSGRDDSQSKTYTKDLMHT